MTIKNNFRQLREEIFSDPVAAEMLRNDAVAAILGGVASGGWFRLMQQFANNPEQLSRLAGLDGTLGDPGKDQARAYLASNSFFGLENDSAWLLDYLDSDLRDSPDSIDTLELPGISFSETAIHKEASLWLTSKKLTPDLLLTTIGPFLKAIRDLQLVIDQVQDRSISEVTIKSLTQSSPVEVTLEGASEAVEQIETNIVPWRRKHAETMTLLSEQEKRAHIKSLEADLLEKEGKLIKDRAEAERIIAERDKLRAEAEQIRLENEKLRIEVQRSKIQLVLDVLSRVAPNLSETEKLGYVVKLLPSIEELTSTELTPRKKNPS